MSLIYLAARVADGASVYTGPDSARPPLSRSTNGAGASLVETSPMPGSMTMCAPLPLGASPPMGSDQFTLWPEAHPAKTPAQPTASKAARGSTDLARDCSGKPSASSENSDPIGLALRTSLLSELAAMTGYTMRWKRRATPSGRSWWVLCAQAPHTSGSVFGLLPAPRCCNGLRSRGINQTEILRRLLPTPRKSQGGADPTSHSPNLRSKVGNIGTAALLTLSEWMMGYPRDWLSRSLLPMAMPSSRKSRKQSDVRS